MNGLAGLPPPLRLRSVTEFKKRLTTMAVIDDLYIRILADGSQLESGLNHAQSKVDGFSNGISKLGDQLKEAFGILAIEQFIVKSMEAADAADRALAKVAQAIESTGGAAGRSLEELRSAADDFKKSTLFDDDQVLNDVSAQLLTFGNLAGENFMRAQVAALDLATVLGDGEGLKGISIQLGKALNDPVQGLTALKRSGVSFSEEQIGVIKNLAETNRLAEAQTIILDALATQYGGQAEAAAKASNGMVQFDHDLEDVMKVMGRAINTSGVFKDLLEDLSGMAYAWASPDIRWWDALDVTIFGLGHDLKVATEDAIKLREVMSKVGITGFPIVPESSQPSTLAPAKKKDTTYHDLKVQLKEYQDALETSTDKTKVEINKQIEHQKGLIKAWEDSGKAVANYSGTLKGMGLEITALEEKKSTAKDPARIAALNELIEQKKDEKRVLENVTTAWVEYGNKVNETVNGRVVPSVSKMTSTWQQMSVAVPKALEHVHDATDKLFAKMTTDMKAVNSALSDALKSAISSVATSLGTLIGDLINGTTSEGDAMLGSLGKIIGQVGQMAIAIGTAMLTIQLTLANPLNPALPITLIGLGIAAVALGQVFSNASKSIASGGSASGSYSSGGGGYTYDTRSAQGDVKQVIELRLQGRDFVGAIEINKRYYSRQG